MKIFELFSPKSHWKGLVCYAVGRYRDGIDHFLSAIRESPIYAPSHFKLGMCYYQLEKWCEAHAHIKAALLLDARQTKWRAKLEHLERKSSENARAEEIVINAQPDLSVRVASRHILNVLILGARGHGKVHIRNFLAISSCRISYVCDVDLSVANAAADAIQAETGSRPRVLQDFRHALDDKALDIVSIATPHHWHAPAAIWAIQAGKHVYLEKPVSHTFLEGELLVAVAREKRVMVQCGTQLRSNTSLRTAADYIQSGELGEVRLAHCITYKRRLPIPVPLNCKVPDSASYDLWIGPASMSPLTRNRLHYDWHWFWEFGNGALGNNGIHRIDVARIGLGLEGFGDAVLSYGGRFGSPDSGDTPNTLVTIHRFSNVWVVHDICGLPKKAYKTVRNGIIFYGTKGLVIYQDGFASLCDADGAVISRFEGKQENHYQNFIDSILYGVDKKLAGDLYEGHVSSGLCHLGNISYRLGSMVDDLSISRRVSQLEPPQMIKDLLKRVRSNLRANGDDRPLILGDLLQIEKSNGHIRNHPQASELMSKKYRYGFEI